MPEKRNLPAKREPRHGIYSWVNSKKIPSGRAFQSVRRQLGIMREELVRAHGGGKISPDAQILVDSTVEALGVQKLLGLYVRKYGVVDGQAAKRGRLELSPILAKNWIAYGNIVRQGLLALRELDKGVGRDDSPDLNAILAEYEPVPDPTAVGPGRPAAGRSSADGSDGQGVDGPGGGDFGADDEERAPGSAQEDRSAGDEGQKSGSSDDYPEEKANGK